RTCATYSGRASTTASRSVAPARKCGARASASTARSSGTAKRWPTGGRATPASTRARTARRACRPGSRRRSLTLRRDARGPGRPGRPARALLRRRLLRPRPEADELRFASVGRVPRVVVEQLPAGGIDEPADARRARRLAVVVDLPHTSEERRVRGSPHWRLAR